MTAVWPNCVHRSGKPQHSSESPLVSNVPVDCSLLIAARLAGAALLGLAIVALEAWLRVPVRPLFDGYMQDAQARVAALIRQLSF